MNHCGIFIRGFEIRRSKKEREICFILNDKEEYIMQRRNVLFSVSMNGVVIIPGFNRFYLARVLTRTNFSIIIYNTTNNEIVNIPGTFLK